MEYPVCGQWPVDGLNKDFRYLLIKSINLTWGLEDDGTAGLCPFNIANLFSISFWDTLLASEKDKLHVDSLNPLLIKCIIFKKFCKNYVILHAFFHI